MLWMLLYKWQSDRVKDSRFISKSCFVQTSLDVINLPVWVDNLAELWKWQNFTFYNTILAYAACATKLATMHYREAYFIAKPFIATHTNTFAFLAWQTSVVAALVFFHSSGDHLVINTHCEGCIHRYWSIAGVTRIVVSSDTLILSHGDGCIDDHRCVRIVEMISDCVMKRLLLHQLCLFAGSVLYKFCW